MRGSAPFMLKYLHTVYWTQVVQCHNTESVKCQTVRLTWCNSTAFSHCYRADKQADRGRTLHHTELCSADIKQLSQKRPSPVHKRRKPRIYILNYRVPCQAETKSNIVAGLKFLFYEHSQACQFGKEWC